MKNNNKLNFKINNEENLLQKNISNLNKKIVGLETKIFNLEQDIKDMEKKFNKIKAFWLHKFNAFYRKIIIISITVLPFIAIIITGLVFWIIIKFIK
ncbi:hypothetical protein [Borreliella andersonii]|uniref:hypothetical protein n=1 Tax=Borrelia andersonii TaxID=42109 RepID=UPI003AB757D2